MVFCLPRQPGSNSRLEKLGHEDRYQRGDSGLKQWKVFCFDVCGIPMHSNQTELK